MEGLIKILAEFLDFPAIILLRNELKNFIQLIREYESDINFSIDQNELKDKDKDK